MVSQVLLHLAEVVDFNVLVVARELGPRTDKGVRTKLEMAKVIRSQSYILIIIIIQILTAHENSVHARTKVRAASLTSVTKVFRTTSLPVDRFECFVRLILAHCLSIISSTTTRGLTIIFNL